MEKLSMREYLVDLEARIDKALRKWKKYRMENGGSDPVHLSWQFDKSHIIMDVFWQDDEEYIDLECKRPGHKHLDHTFKGLTEETMDRVMDRVGNFAMIVMSQTHE